MDDRTPKRKNHPSRIRQGWHSLQIRSLRMCIVLFIAMTIHGALLFIADVTATDESTLYIYNSINLFLVMMLALGFFAIVHITYHRKQGAMLLASVVVYIVIWLMIPMNVFWTHWHFDTEYLDNRVYHLSGDYIGSIISPLIPGIDNPMVREFRLYACDSLGLICRMVYRDRQLDEWYSPSAHLRVDAANHRISLVIANRVVYTYPEGGSLTRKKSAVNHESRPIGTVYKRAHYAFVSRCCW